MHRSEGNLPNAVIIQIVLDEFADAPQCSLGVLHEVLIMNFHVIGAYLLPVAPALAHLPSPEQGRRHDGATAVPRQRADPSDALQRGGDVAPVANNVDDERVGNRLLDQRKEQQVRGRTFGPAPDALFAGDRFHHDAQEVAGMPAILHDALFDFLALKSSALKQHAFEEVVEQTAPIVPVGKVAEEQAEQIEGIAF